MAISGLLAFMGLSPLRVMNDLLFLEVGLFAVLGGLTEFSQSIGAREFRRVAFHTTDEFSVEKQKEASRKALVLFSAALLLFSLLIVLALLE